MTSKLIPKLSLARKNQILTTTKKIRMNPRAKLKKVRK